MNFLIDDISLTVTCETDLRLGNLERRLRQQGYTLGYEPAGTKDPSLRRILNQAIPNRWAARHGEIRDICMAVVVRNETGEIRTKKVPRAATGPDLRKIFIGSKGLYGEITEATFRVSPLPEKRKTLKIRLGKKSQAALVLRGILAGGLRPAEIREKGGFLSVTLEGASSIVRAEEHALKKIMKKPERARGD